MFDATEAKRALAETGHRLNVAPVEMALFPDRTVTVRWQRVDQTDDFKSQVWIGAVDGYPQGEAIFVVSNNSVTGNITRGDGIIYEVRPNGHGGQAVVEVDQRQLPSELPPPPEPPQLQIAAPRDTAAADDGSTVDVLVVYTPAVTAKAGGAQAAQQLVQLGIAETNRGYENSGITHRVRLAYSGEVQYTETEALDTNLARLRATDDGYLDGVHALRETYAADLVSLWVEGGDACGIGYLLSDAAKPRPDLGFSVVSRSCATGYYSFGHEMGHNMGAMHGRDDGTGPGAFPYSYGFKHLAGSASFRTVMAYDTNCSCTRVLYWSNPSVQYNSVPVGMDPQSSESADNVLTLNNTRTVVANYRTPAPSGGGSGLPESDHPYTNKLDKTWTYTLAGNPVSINVTFDPRTSVEAGYDFIYVYDSNDNPVPGTPFTGGALGGRTITVTGATIKIRLVSDDSTVDFGFKVSSVTGNTGSAGQAPKLVITSFTAPTTGTIGSSLAGTKVTVANEGASAAAAFRIGYYYGHSRNVTTADVYSGWSCGVNDGLAAGANHSCSGEVGVPSTLNPGTWYLAAIADDQNQIQQTERLGNIRVSDSGPITITGGTPAELLAPAPGSVLSSATVVFQWSAGTGVSKYTLAIGTSPSGTEVYNKDQGTSLSVTVGGLPTNGATLYVTVSSLIGSSTQTHSYTLKAATIGSGSNLARLVITSFTAPSSGAIGEVLADTALVVRNEGTGSTGPFEIGYYYSQRSNVGTSDIDSGWACSFAEGLAPGETGTCSGSIGVPATLTPGAWYLAGIADDQNKVPQSDKSGNVRPSDNGPLTITGRAAATITTPAPGSNLASSTVTFEWNGGSGAQGFALMIGTSAGSGDIYNQDQGQNLSATVSGLPANGRTLYVRLTSSFANDSLYNDYTFRAVNAATGGAAPLLAITSFTAPASGTIGGSLPGMNLRVMNRGNANAPPFRIGFYFSHSSTVTVSDVYSGWFCTVDNGLRAGAAFVCTGEIGIPTSLAAGTWYLAAIADDRKQVEQADTSASTRLNDNGPVTLAGGSGGPLPESDHPYANNTDQTWTYTAPGNPASIRVIFDLKTSVEQDYDFIYIYDGNGNEVNGSPFTGTDLAARAVIVNGATVHIRLLSDDSADDYGFKVLAIEDAGRYPRLAVTAFSAPTQGTIGGTLSNVSMTVQNAGDAFASPFQVGYYYSRNATPTVRDIDSTYYCIAEEGVAAGATFTCTGEIGVPPSLAPGTWYVAAIADDLLMVDQPDRSGTTRVSDNGPVTIAAADRKVQPHAAASGVAANAVNQHPSHKAIRRMRQIRP